MSDRGRPRHSGSKAATHPTFLWAGSRKKDWERDWSSHAGLAGHGQHRHARWSRRSTTGALDPVDPSDESTGVTARANPDIAVGTSPLAHSLRPPLAGRQFNPTRTAPFLARFFFSFHCVGNGALVRRGAAGCVSSDGDGGDGAEDRTRPRESFECRVSDPSRRRLSPREPPSSDGWLILDLARGLAAGRRSAPAHGQRPGGGLYATTGPKKPPPVANDPRPSEYSVKYFGVANGQLGVTTRRKPIPGGAGADNAADVAVDGELGAILASAGQRPLSQREAFLAKSDASPSGSPRPKGTVVSAGMIRYDGDDGSGRPSVRGPPSRRTGRASQRGGVAGEALDFELQGVRAGKTQPSEDATRKLEMFGVDMDTATVTETEGVGNVSYEADENDPGGAAAVDATAAEDDGAAAALSSAARTDAGPRTDGGDDEGGGDQEGGPTDCGGAGAVTDPATSIPEDLEYAPSENVDRDTHPPRPGTSNLADATKSAHTASGRPSTTPGGPYGGSMHDSIGRGGTATTKGWMDYGGADDSGGTGNVPWVVNSSVCGRPLRAHGSRSGTKNRAPRPSRDAGLNAGKEAFARRAVSNYGNNGGMTTDMATGESWVSHNGLAGWKLSMTMSYKHAPALPLNGHPGHRR